jgi:hypothetical protein
MADESKAGWIEDSQGGVVGYFADDGSQLAFPPVSRLALDDQTAPRVDKGRLKLTLLGKERAAAEAPKAQGPVKFDAGAVDKVKK